MTNNNGHGGKRKGAGRKQKWSFAIMLKIGQQCETLFRAEEKKTLDRAWRIANTSRQRTWGNQSLTGPSELSSSSVVYQKALKLIGGCGGSGKFKIYLPRLQTSFYLPVII